MMITYSAGIKALLENPWLTSDWRILLWQTCPLADETHDTLDDLGFVECTAANYPTTNATRKALTGKTVTTSTASDEATVSNADTVFTLLGDGDSPQESMGGHVVYLHDASNVDSAHIPLYYDDGTLAVVCSAAAAMSDTLLRVDPLQAALAEGASIAFSGSTATLDAAALAGERELSLSALTGAVAKGALGSAALAGDHYPKTLVGFDFTVPAN